MLCTLRAFWLCLVALPRISSALVFSNNYTYDLTYLDSPLLAALAAEPALLVIEARPAPLGGLLILLRLDVLHTYAKY